MNKLSAAELEVEVAAIRQRMAAQRLIIAHRVDPPADAPPAFPRSKTMQWIVRDPRFATGLVAGASGLFFATRLIRNKPLLPMLAGVVRLVKLLKHS
ncbi:MAG: hypothetical protein IPK97_05035 [Ahniella sp.]|nr:hypothetical protein [Ahniella sp.]